MTNIYSPRYDPNSQKNNNNNDNQNYKNNNFNFIENSSKSKSISPLQHKHQQQNAQQQYNNNSPQVLPNNNKDNNNNDENVVEGATLISNYQNPALQKTAFHNHSNSITNKNSPKPDSKGSVSPQKLPLSPKKEPHSSANGGGTAGSASVRSGDAPSISSLVVGSNWSPRKPSPSPRSDYSPRLPTYGAFLLFFLCVTDV